MCYSARVNADYKTYTRMFGAVMSIKDFYGVFWRRNQEGKLKIPKAMEDAFCDPQTDEEGEIKQLIDAFKAEQATKLEQELVRQRKRVADAERTLQSKPTKAATDSQRIASDKIASTLRRLADLRRTEGIDSDSRIFPGTYAPVMVWEDGQRVVKPMRYQCRPAGKPAFYDIKFPGTYNARRDNLEGFWKGQFGHTHGLMVVNAFYENVNLHRSERRELADGEDVRNLILEFRPRPTQDMLVACLWSKWTGPGEPDLLSFAAITDHPPEEVAIAGHDRCIVPIRAENIDAWLRPDPNNLAALNSILDDRQRPYYEHRLAA